MKNDLNIMKPLSSKIPKYTMYGFDIETIGKKNDFLMGSIVGENLKKVFWDKEEMCEYITKTSLFYKQARVFATNLSFDILALFAGTSYMSAIEPLLRGSSFICAKYRQQSKELKSPKHILFLDTMNFAPMSVKKIGQILNLPKLETPAYINERRQPKESEYDEVEEYNIRDSLITYEFAEWLQNEFNREGAKMRLTVASTAMDLFKRQYHKEAWFQEPKWIMDKLYNGYYGGRTEVLKRGYEKKLNYYDYNSLYPSAMINDYPNVNHQRFIKKGNMDIIDTYEGISKVEVHAPDIDIPLLPFRLDHKLVFPTGRFSGYYTNLEIREAIKVGYEIKWIGEQIYYTRTHRPFDDYVKDQYKKRQEFQANESPAQIINKLFMNSLYGKFAQKIDGKETIYNMDSLDVDKMKKLMTRGKLSVIGDFAYFTENEPSYIPHHIFPIYSIYVTAYGRIKLWKMAKKCDPYYMDTDSLITKKVLDGSSKLGDLKKEYRIKEGIFCKPKMYAFVDGDGESHVKVKGLPPSRNWDFNGFKKFLTDPTAKYEKFTRFKESNRRGFAYNEIIEMSKTLKLEDEKRIWENPFNASLLQQSNPLMIR